MQWRGVRRLSVCPSVNFCANRFFLQANGRIVTKLAQDGLQVSVHRGCAQGQGQGQRSRDTRTFLDSWNELLRHWRSGWSYLSVISIVRTAQATGTLQMLGSIPFDSLVTIASYGRSVSGKPNVSSGEIACHAYSCWYWRRWYDRRGTDVKAHQTHCSANQWGCYAESKKSLYTFSHAAATAIRR